MDKFQTEVSAFEAIGERLRADGFGRHEFNTIHRSAQSLATIVNADSSGSSRQHAQRVAIAAEKFQSHAQRVRANLAERERGGLQALAEARKERLGMQTDKYVLPIIESFRNAPDQQTRLKWLAEATRQGDGRTLAALSEAPEYVTGIDRETLDQHLLSAEQTHAPDLSQRRQQFDSDRDALQAALTQADRIAARAVDLESVEAARAADEAEAELARQTA